MAHPHKTVDEPMRNELSAMQKKCAFALTFNVQKLAEKWGLAFLGFLTLTFPDRVTIKEAQRRFHNFRCNILSSHFVAGIVVVERGYQSGRVHFHLLVVCRQDIRTGTDWEGLERAMGLSVDARQFPKGHPERKRLQKAASELYGASANEALRAEWAFLRDACKGYGFGRHELLPVKSNSQAIAKYVGKYIAKHIDCRRPEDKGARLVRCFGGADACNTKFDWATKGARLWRQALARTAKECGIKDYWEFSHRFGPKWAFVLKHSIIHPPAPVTRDHPSCTKPILRYGEIRKRSDNTLTPIKEATFSKPLTRVNHLTKQSCGGQSSWTACSAPREID